MLLGTLIFSSKVHAMPNPSAVFCEEQGYHSEIRRNSNGGSYGVCIFPDGEECGGWDFYNGACGEEYRKKPYKTILIIAGALFLMGSIVRFSKRIIKHFHKR